MTYQELEKLGWETIAKDTNSFVSKFPGTEVWLELFYCKEKNYLQIMRGTFGDKGQILRHNLYEGTYEGTDVIQQLTR